MLCETNDSSEAISPDYWDPLTQENRIRAVRHIVSQSQPTTDVALAEDSTRRLTTLLPSQVGVVAQTDVSPRLVSQKIVLALCHYNYPEGVRILGFSHHIHVLLSAALFPTVCSAAHQRARG